MEIGVYSRTYSGSLRESMNAARGSGITRLHLNLQSAGMETMPERADDAQMYRIGRLADETGVVLDGLSGTFNMIAPDLAEREEGVSRFPALCRIAAMLSIPLISLCTGSRNPKSRWEWDDRNLLPDAWDDLLRTTERLLPLAEQAGVVLGVEPEASNVVNTAARARRYLDYFQSPNLKIILDGANLFPSGEPADMRGTLDEAFRLLGGDVVQAHAKDLMPGPGLAFCAAGEGILDFPYVVSLLRKYGFEGTVMLHGLAPAQVKKSADYLRGLFVHA